MKKALIIDDDPDIRILMEVLLKQAGYDVETACGREEALNKIALLRPSVILLDVLLSGSDGRDLCKEIKALDLVNSTPVIMLSAHPGAADNIKSYGADDFAAKPINTEMLLIKLKRLVKTEE